VYYQLGSSEDGAFALSPLSECASLELHVSFMQQGEMKAIVRVRSVMTNFYRIVSKKVGNLNLSVPGTIIYTPTRALRSTSLTNCTVPRQCMLIKCLKSNVAELVRA